jgi:hypothetical protein
MKMNYIIYTLAVIRWAENVVKSHHYSPMQNRRSIDITTAIPRTHRHTIICKQQLCLQRNNINASC